MINQLPCGHHHKMPPRLESIACNSIMIIVKTTNMPTNSKSCMSLEKWCTKNQSEQASDICQQVPVEHFENQVVISHLNTKLQSKHSNSSNLYKKL